MPVIPFEPDGLGPLVITEAPLRSPPFPVDAVVEEDDTYHVLSGDSSFRPANDHPIRILADAHAAQPTPPGTVIVRPGAPLHLLAVVHALDENPPCRAAWVDLAYRNLLREVDGRQLTAVATPLLGTVHGRIDRSRSRALLDRALEAHRPASLARIWMLDDPR
jgi:hypothetical protein